MTLPQLDPQHAALARPGLARLPQSSSVTCVWVFDSDKCTNLDTTFQFRENAFTGTNREKCVVYFCLQDLFDAPSFNTGTGVREDRRSRQEISESS